MKRRIRGIVICLIIGAIVSVVVAWLCANLSVAGSAGGRPYLGDRARRMWCDSTGVPAEDLRIWGTVWSGLGVNEYSVGADSDLALMSAQGRSALGGLEVTTAGLPFRCLQRARYTWNGKTTSIGSIELSGSLWIL